jgi:hypothetical protein
MNRRANRDSLTRHILPPEPDARRQFLPRPARIAEPIRQHPNMVNRRAAVFRHFLGNWKLFPGGREIATHLRLPQVRGRCV